MYGEIQIGFGDALARGRSMVEVPFKKLNKAQQERELRGIERLSKEGLTPEAALRGRTRVWSWNCQMANNERLGWWSPCFKDAIVLFQGTQRTYNADRGEKALQQWTTGEHDVIEFKVVRKAQGGHRPEGVLMLFPRGVRHTLKKLMVPQDKALEGRGMAV